MKSKTKTYTRLLNVSIDLALRVMWYLLLEADVGSGKWFLGDKRTGEITEIIKPPADEWWSLMPWPDEHSPTYVSIPPKSETHWDSFVIETTFACCTRSRVAENFAFVAVRNACRLSEMGR